jgi:hypothetical protein
LQRKKKHPEKKVGISRQMVLHKEYRIVLPVSVEEYRCAQVYMTSRTSLMEAMDSDGAGVEILANRPAEHHTLGPCQYTKKVFHIDKRFPSWLRIIAPKSGSYLLEESWNAYPSTITEVTFPMFNSFRILVESHHLPDRGERFRPSLPLLLLSFLLPLFPPSRSLSPSSLSLSPSPAPPHPVGCLRLGGAGAFKSVQLTALRWGGVPRGRRLNAATTCSNLHALGKTARKNEYKLK